MGSFLNGLKRSDESREMGSFLNGLKRSDASREIGSFLNGLKRSDEQESSHIAAPVGTPQEVATPKVTPGVAFILAAPVIARSLTATTKRADQYASFAKRMEAPPVANSEMVIGFRTVPIHSQAAPMIADQVHHQVVVPVVAHQPVADRRLVRRLGDELGRRSWEQLDCGLGQLE